MTTGKLRAVLVDEILAYDPQAVIGRRKEAEKGARVETWTEAAGTGAIAGRDLPPADVLAADKTLDADARWLNAHGADGTMDQLRAKAFTARLTGQPLDSLLTPSPGTGAGASLSPGSRASTTPSPGSGPSSARAPGSPAAGGLPAGLSSVNLTMPGSAWLG